MAVTSAQVQELYVGLLGRAADKAGLDYWLGQLNATGSTLTLENLRANFVNEQAEYAATYGNLARADLVKAIYTNLFERTPTTEEVNYWANGSVSADQMVVAFLNGASAADKQVVGNKTYVAQTYTDTVGASYNAAGAKAVVENVDGTAASVSTALNSITTGTLAGQIPGLSLISAVANANDAITAYGKAAATANASFDAAPKDGSVSSAEASTALSAANTARFDATTGVSTKSTSVLSAESTDAAAAVAAAKTAAISVTNGAAAVTAYDNAVAADTAAKAAVAANATAAAAADAGLASALGASGATVTLGTLGTAAGTTFTNTAEVTTFLADPASNAVQRAALVTELNKVATYGSEFVKAGNLKLDAAKAAAALTTADSNLKAIDSDAAGALEEGQDYIDAVTASKAASDLLAKAQAADVKLAAAKTVVDQYTVLNKALADAKAAVTTFETANSTKIDFHEVGAGAVAVTASSTKSDVIYFGSKIAAVNDGAITNFGAGDSIVLGSAHAQGSSLAAGNANSLEFFLVQGSSGVQVVIESAAYGNSTTTVDAAGNVTASPDAAVITLTGVTADHLSFSNGVISYV